MVTQSLVLKPNLLTRFLKDAVNKIAVTSIHNIEDDNML